MLKEGEQDIILFVGTYPPRECGIATFTRDLTDAIDKKFFPFLKTKILSMNNNGVNIYNYPKKVLYQLSDTNRADYMKIAEKINNNPSIKLVSVQHEFGIFGSDYPERPGEYLVDFLKVLKKPKIITCHSVLPNPDLPKLKTMREIAKNVDEIIVMTQTGVDVLRYSYNIRTPIRVIPHGIPTVAFESQSNAKKHFGYQDKIILSSFGMMNEGKGYEHVIDALPNVVKRYPNLVYLIVGATHPIVRKNEGEKYRNFLDRKIKKMGLQDNVKFYNKYINLKEIVQYLKATDVYISSTLTPEQITSGTLAYAVGCGRACISTPFLHAKDLLKEGRGILLNGFRKSEEFESALLSILSDKVKRRDIEETAYAYTRQMIWPNVAISYGEIIKRYVKMPEIYFGYLPRINTLHLRKMTDDFGMVQFAHHTKPDHKSGYTLDDNSRALIVACKLYMRYRQPRILGMVKTYLKFIQHVQGADGKLYNMINKEKIVDKKSWSEEAHGRAINALGFLTSMQIIPPEVKLEARSILSQALKATGEIHAPRAISSIISGLYYYNKENYSDATIKLMEKFSDDLMTLYIENKSDDWQWFEHELTYANSKISESLFYAYMLTQKEKYLVVAKESVNFLISKTFEKGIFVPIGQNGWYKKGGNRAYYDQQPIDVASTVQTLTLAYKLTGDLDYEKKALAAFQWFLGKNTLNQVVYNETTGGCYDGLDKNDANLNQGAESTLEYFLARLTLDEII